MNYGQNSAVTQTAPTPSTAIPAAMADLSQSINEMGVLSDALVSRLGGVLQPMRSEPQTQGGERATLAAAPPLVSVMVDELQGYRRRVQSITAQVQDALSRLEV